MSDIAGVSARSWEMWAGERTLTESNEVVFCYAAPGRRYPESYGKTPVRVVVAENPEGRYWAWLPLVDRATGEPVEDTYPRFVFDRESLFSMCFPYGYANEEAAGRGRLIRLNITRI